MRKSRNRAAPLIMAVLFFICVFDISSQQPDTGDVDMQQQDLRTGSLMDRFEQMKDALPPLEIDSNGDGRTDYMIQTHLETGDKIMEALDYNHDGDMDDFYYYTKGILTERAIDSNYDSYVDLWVYIEEGVYISGYEKDTDFDGSMDEVKNYSESSRNEQ